VATLIRSYSALAVSQWALSSWEIGDGMWDWWLDEHRGGSRVGWSSP